MKNPMNLSGRNVLVTGAAQGIGLATVNLMASLEANITLIDQNEAALLNAQAALPADRSMVLAGSVTDRAFIDSAIERSVQRFGGIHGLVNNAGITRTAMIENMTSEEWQAVIDVNLTGAFNVLQAVGREMIGRARSGDTEFASTVWPMGLWKPP